MILITKSKNLNENNFLNLKQMGLLINVIWIIIALISLYISYKQYKKHTYINFFKKYLKNKNDWYKENIEDIEIYRYKKDVNFEIYVKNVWKWGTKEKWIPDFPDKENNSKLEVFLRYNWKNIYKTILFIALDWFRFILPVPEYFEPNNEYLYKKDNIEFFLNNLIGEYPWWIYPKDIYEFCEKYYVNLN